MPQPRFPALLQLALLAALLLAAAAQDPQLLPVQSNETEADLLLMFKAGIENWDEVAADRKLNGWDCASGADCTPVCAWGGVTCNPYHVHEGNFVNELRLGCNGCGVKLRGQLLPGIQRLQHLELLYLDNNELYGPLPPEWGEPGGFPELLELNVNQNQLTGNMPDNWAVGPAFLNLADLQMASNRFSGTFPAGFAVTNSSFISVMSFSFANNQFSGTLPSYINGMITMSVVELHNNRFTGTLPPDWGTQGYYWNSSFNATQALEYLTLHGNNLTGGLPAGWAQPGSFQVLKQLTLSDNPHLGGTLPPDWGNSTDALQLLQNLNISYSGLTGSLPPWGAPGYPGLQQLTTLTLQGNSLTGTVPASWGKLQQLSRVTLLPGNPGLCADKPPGANFKVCQADDQLCRPSSSDDAVCAALGSTGGDSSSFPVAAVAVPVAVVGALGLAAGGFLVWRKRQQQAAVEPSSTASAVYKDAESGLYYSADGKPLVMLKPGSPGGPHPNGVAGGSSGTGSWLPCFRSRSMELEPMHSNATTSTVARSAPLWLPGDVQHSTTSLPAVHSAGSGQAGGGSGQVGSGSGLSPPQASSELPGGAGTDSPAFTSKELSTLLSDWEIKPEEIQILKRSDGSEWRLGAGGFGTVYKAMRNGVQPVAVKVLGVANSEAVKSMSDEDFVREISILRACRDTNILQFQGACFKDDRTMLVTEYMEGGNLSHNLRAKRVSWYRRGKKIALDVARALVYLHSRKIVHLDIKSANVLLTRDGTAKVGDVGMAKILQGGYVSGVVGTLAWSAPELLLGHRCTAKADMYSFGVVLWEIVTGEMPVRGQLRDPRVPEECPPEMLALFYRCVDPDPATRPTATECVELLQQAPDKQPDVVLPAAGPASVLASPFAASSVAPSSRGSAGASVPPSAGGSAGAEQWQQQQQQQQPPWAAAAGGPSPAVSRAGSGRPPRVRTRSMQAALEEEIVAEAMAELHSGSSPMMSDSRLLVRGGQPNGGGGGGGEGRFRRHSTRLPQPADSRGRNVLTRRMVLTTSASLNSPFQRPPLPPGAPSPADGPPLLPEDSSQQASAGAEQQANGEQQQPRAEQPHQHQQQQQLPLPQQPAESQAGAAPPKQRRHRRPHRERSVACTPAAAQQQPQQQAAPRPMVSPFQRARERDGGAPPFQAQPPAQPNGQGPQQQESKACSD